MRTQRLLSESYFILCNDLSFNSSITQPIITTFQFNDKISTLDSFCTTELFYKYILSINSNYNIILYRQQVIFLGQLL